MASDGPVVPISVPVSSDVKAIRTYKKEAIIFLVLICILAAFTFVMIIENNGLQGRITRLERKNASLEDEVDDLSIQKSDLQSEISRLQRVADENKFEFYYADLAQQRYGVDDLQGYLDRWEWVEGSYVLNSFDCSEMSAYIERRLESEGYHTIIVVGDAPFGGGYHAWLLVETSAGAYMPVEATLYDMVLWSSPYFDGYFEYDRSFEAIQEALDYSQNEFDWWNS
jgi:cell division protein FtsB